MALMATAPGHGVRQGGIRRVVSCGLVASLLTPACAAPGPRATLPAAASEEDRTRCERLAGKTEAGIQGSSVWAGTATGAAAGSLPGAYGAARGSVASGTDAIFAGVFFGAMVAIGAGVGALHAAAKTAGARSAAHHEAMAACLRPAILERELGTEHPEVARSLHALAFRYHRQADLAEAEPLYVRALTIQERSLGPDAPEIATTLDDYARLLRETGRVSEAEALERRVRAIRQKP
jgi:hypothetical protein